MASISDSSFNKITDTASEVHTYVTKIVPDSFHQKMIGIITRVLVQKENGSIPSEEVVKAGVEFKLHMFHLLNYHTPDQKTLEAYSKVEIVPMDEVRQFDTVQVNAWVNAHVGDMQRILTRLASEITYISKKAFEEKLDILVGHFIDYVLTNSISKITAVIDEKSEKSSEWITELVKHHPQVTKELPEDILEVCKPDVLTREKSDNVFVIFDDAAYSGQQLAKMIKEIALKTTGTSEENDRRPELRIVIASVFMTTIAEKLINEKSNEMNVKLVVLDHFLMKTIAEVLNSSQDTDILNKHWYPNEIGAEKKPKPKQMQIFLQKQSYLNMPEITSNTGTHHDVVQYQKGCSSRTLTYFEHKVADKLSFPEALTLGRVYPLGVTKITYVIIPGSNPEMKSPYKLSELIKNIGDLANRIILGTIKLSSTELDQSQIANTSSPIESKDK